MLCCIYWLWDVQERLDFSCAMFGPNGGLVANAPHIPVHLGAMQEAVQYQVGMFSLAVYFAGIHVSISAT